MGMEPVLAVYAGYSLDHTSVPENEMEWVLQEALDEIAYLTDPITTKLGALRALHGHPEPVQLKYVEIGNEDWFSSTYPYRFAYLYNGINRAHPNIKLISSAFDAAQWSFNYTIDLPKGSMWDHHDYDWPGAFTNNFNYFDNWQENTNNSDVEIMLGEYSLFSAIGPVNWTNTQTPVHVYYPEMISAVEEGLYLLGIERNSKVVKMTCWAPSLAHYLGYQLTPNVCYLFLPSFLYLLPPLFHIISFPLPSHHIFYPQNLLLRNTNEKIVSYIHNKSKRYAPKHFILPTTTIQQIPRH